MNPYYLLEGEGREDRRWEGCEEDLIWISSNKVSPCLLRIYLSLSLAKPRGSSIRKIDQSQVGLTESRDAF